MKITLLILMGFMVIALGSMAVLARTIRDNIQTQYSQAAEEPLVDFAHLLASVLEREIKSEDISVEQFSTGIDQAFMRQFVAQIYHLRKDRIQTNVYITNKDGIVIFDSDNGKREGLDYSQFNDVYNTKLGKYGKRASRTNQRDPRTTVFYVAAPIRHQGNFAGTLTVFRPEIAMAPFAEESEALVMKWSITAGIVTMVLGALWLSILLYPIRNLTLHAKAIAEGKSRKLPITGRAELRNLSVALEEMRRELEGKHYVENYVQALTHELRSPLAAIRGAAELIDQSDNMPAEKRKHFLNNILAETTRSEDLVRRLVQLAALESQSVLGSRQSIQVSDWIESSVNEFAAAAEAKNASIELDNQLSETDTIEGDPLMLQIALRNVLNNAIDFSPSGGVIKVICSREKNDLKIAIHDQGPGLPDYALGRVFERFYSLKNKETGRKGSGIGLCLTKETMQLHNGEVTLENAHKGGTLATLRLPLQRDKTFV